MDLLEVAAWSWLVLLVGGLAAFLAYRAALDPEFRAALLFGLVGGLLVLVTIRALFFLAERHVERRSEDRP